MKVPDFSETRVEPYESATLPRPAGDLWVFGYGSLMWAPGFAVAQSARARLYGYHRRLCLWSIHYRGTAARPGLVLGLDRGGSCSGVALRVARRDARAVSAYLLQREMLNNAYRPTIKKVYLEHGWVHALTFISKQTHPQFAHPMSVQDAASVVFRAQGEGGKNRDYVLNTVRHLREFQIESAELVAIAERLC